MDIEKIKGRLLVKYPLFGSVVANSNFVGEQSVGTAGTDGKNIYYNPNFLETITEQQQTFIFAHEICHIAFDHIHRSEGKDPELWNIATDSVVNAFLKQDGLPLVDGGVDIPDAINYDAEEMYNKLLNEKKQKENNNSNQNKQESQNSSDSNNQNEQNSSSSQTESKDDSRQNNSNASNTGNSNESNNDVGHDTHSMWKKKLEEELNEKQESPNTNKNDDSEDKEKSEHSSQKESIFDKIRKMLEKKKEMEESSSSNQIKNNHDNELEKQIKKISDLGEKETFKQNKIERKKQLEELRKSLASQSHGHGNDTNSELRSIKDIGISEPLIDWRRLLKEAVKYDVDWSYQNAGIEDGVVTAYLEEMPKPETEIVLDTSGSVDEDLLRNFLRECKNILQNSRVKVGCFDTKFYGFTEIKDISDIDNLEFYGGGGTDFDAAVGAFTNRVENKIIFTDGEADMPGQAIDAIWIVFGGRRINPKGGKVINISEEQLSKLLNNYYVENQSHGKIR